MNLMRFFINLLPFLLLVPSLAAGPPVDNPVEIGLVRWQRDFPGSLNAAGRSGKPILLLFQEVPGCIGCQTFGAEVLSHPLLVEAIEDNFIPVLVYNNRSSGMDKELLDRFSEPSWNFQVMRFLNGQGEDIIPRKDQVWTVAETAARMVLSLEASNRPAPRYLHNLVLEEDRDNHRLLPFAMFCFWTGEYTFGGIDGVVGTEAGFYQGREVTLVRYHHHRLSQDELIRQAAQQQCATMVYGHPGEEFEAHGLDRGVWQESHYKRAPDEDQKKQLQRVFSLRDLASLTPMQLTKLNALLPDDRPVALEFLSPRQRRNLGLVEARAQ
jgi:Thioredoxin-like